MTNGSGGFSSALKTVVARYIEKLCFFQDDVALYFAAPPNKQHPKHL